MRKHPVNRWTKQHIGGPRYIEVGTDERVLVVEDALHKQMTFQKWLGPQAKIVSKPDAAIREINQQRFDWMFLDRDLGFGVTSDPIAEHTAKIKFAGRVVIHSENEFGAQFMKKILCNAGVSVELIPFGILGIFRNPTKTTEVTK
jgi:hypothetical protein